MGNTIVEPQQQPPDAVREEAPGNAEYERMDAPPAASQAVPRHEILTTSPPSATEFDRTRQPVSPGPVVAVGQSANRLRGENVR